MLDCSHDPSYNSIKAEILRKCFAISGFVLVLLFASAALKVGAIDFDLRRGFTFRGAELCVKEGKELKRLFRAGSFPLPYLLTWLQVL